MKSSFLTTVAAALLAGTSFAAAQNAEPRQDQKVPPSVQMNQDRAQNPAQNKAAPAAQDKAAQDKAKDNFRSAQQPQQPAPNASTTGQGTAAPDNRRQPNAAPEAPAAQQPRTGQGAGSSATPNANTSAQTQGRGQPANESVTLTEQQKTTIRQTVIDARSAPKVANVNFAVDVGTEVPRTVHVVAVPEPLYRIHPAWRGQLYFVVNDEIIIVDARTHRIVAVLVV